MKDQYQHYLELLKGLRLMDDDFFSEALDEKIEPVEYILRTILERNDIKVQCTEAQVEYKSATKRSIKLDIRAVDTEATYWTSRSSGQTRVPASAGRASTAVSSTGRYWKKVKILTHWWTPMSSSSLSMTNMVQACRYIM